MALADVAAVVLLILWAIWWPIGKALHGLVFLLSPVCLLLHFLLLPFLHLGHTVVNITTFPFGVKWLDRIEALYVFLGTAGLIGCITGGVLFVIFKFLSSSLNIDKTIVPKNKDQGRTTAEYRAARREKKAESIPSSPSGTPVVLRKTGPRRRGLLSQAIIEEEDSDF